MRVCLACTRPAIVKRRRRLVAAAVDREYFAPRLFGLTEPIGCRCREIACVGGGYHDRVGLRIGYVVGADRKAQFRHVRGKGVVLQIEALLVGRNLQQGCLCLVALGPGSELAIARVRN